MSSKSCPRCGRNAIVTGMGAMLLGDQFFQPFGIRWLGHLLRRFGQATAVRLPEPYQACLDCGLVWNNLRPEVLRKLCERERITTGVKEKELEIDW
jgi:hypothetical protein